MNSKTIFSLSEYQRATLTEMGISTWQQVATSDTFSDVDCSEKNKIMKPPLPETKDNHSQDPGSGIKSDRHKAKSIPQHILLLIPEAQSTLPLLKDVLNTLNLPLNAPIIVSEGDLGDYTDQRLAWKLAPDIALNGAVLSTPDLTALADPEAKKQLWKILQTSSQFV